MRQLKALNERLTAHYDWVDPHQEITPKFDSVTAADVISKEGPMHPPKLKKKSRPSTVAHLTTSSKEEDFGKTWFLKDWEVRWENIIHHAIQNNNSHSISSTLADLQYIERLATSASRSDEAAEICHEKCI